MRTLAVFAGVLAFLAAAGRCPGSVMSVQVRDGQIRQTPSFLGKVVASVSYGDQVTVLSEKSGWSQVRLSSGSTGWIHGSALTPDKIQVQAGGSRVGTGASAEELALAGKGFNSDVEGEFKKRHQDIDFSWIDRMEKIVITPEETVVFLKAGEVAPAEGGSR